MVADGISEDIVLPAGVNCHSLLDLPFLQRLTFSQLGKNISGPLCKDALALALLRRISQIFRNQTPDQRSAPDPFLDWPRPGNPISSNERRTEFDKEGGKS